MSTQSSNQEIIKQDIHSMLVQNFGVADPQMLDEIFRDVVNNVPESLLSNRSIINAAIDKHKTRLLSSSKGDNKADSSPKINIEIQPSQNIQSDIDLIEKQKLYERLYFNVTLALAQEKSEIRRKLLLEATSSIDSNGFTYEEINNYIQSKHPGLALISGADLYHKIYATQNNYRYTRPFSASDLSVAILQNNAALIKEIYKQNDSLCDVKDVNNSTPLNYFAFLPNYHDYLDILIPKAGRNINEVSQFIENSQSRFMVGLSYSTQDFAGLFGYGYEHLMSLMVKDLPDFKDKDIVQKSLAIVSKKEHFSLQNNAKFSALKVIEAPYPNHAAYFVIKYDKNNNPACISYCDGNLIHDGKSGEVVFDIDPQKYHNIHNQYGSLEGFLSKEFKDIYQNASTQTARDLGSKFNHVIADLVVTDEENNPSIIEKNVESQRQNRGNCSYKAVKLVSEAVAKTIDPEFGSMKECTKRLTQKSLRNLLETAEQDDFRDKTNYQQTVEDLKPAFLQAIKKGHENITQRIGNILEKENVDFQEIRAQNWGNKNITEIFGTLKQKQEHLILSPKENKSLNIISNLISPDSKTQIRHSQKELPTTPLKSQDTLDLNHHVH